MKSSEEDSMLKQFLCAALLCGDAIPNENSDSNPDPVQQFLEKGVEQRMTFAHAEEEGYIRQDDFKGDYVVTDKGKEFLR